MQLISLSVSNFRSIMNANKLPVSQKTILIGPNNEGKSNILDALSIGMGVIEAYARSVRSREVPVRRLYRDLYDWDRDFPINLQASKPKGQSIFRLEFQLTDDETTEFKAIVKSNLNGTLPIEIRIGPDHDPAFKVLKRGPGGPALSGKANKIARFVGERLEFNYIPAVRTSDATSEVVSRIVQKKLASLESNAEYQEAIEKVAQLQRPILREISKDITRTLKKFLPDVKSVSVDVPDRMRYRSLRRDCEIVVDDGTATSLERKGDGIKSLAAISLLYGAETTKDATIMALEEPESHLHPGAIHRLRTVLSELSTKSQIVMTTHNPLFVDRVIVRNNILVLDNCASPAGSIEEIRKILGVRASDNLRHARVVLVVEGESDRKILAALMSHKSVKIKKKLESNELAIEPLSGSGNLTHKLHELQSALCISHIYLDHDAAGKEAFRAANSENLIDIKDASFSTCKGMTDSEMEDCISKSVYETALLKELGVKLKGKTFGHGKRKWSERMKETFQDQAKTWNKGIMNRVKTLVAECVAKNPQDALCHVKGASVLALVEALELKLSAADAE